MRLRTSTTGELALAASTDADVVTAADGSFALPAERARGGLAALDERLTTVLEGTPVRASSGHETLIVVAPRIEVAGLVLDEFGLPIAGARVRLEAPPDLRARLSAVLDFSTDVRRHVQTDGQGRFELAAAPAIPGAELATHPDGFLPREEEAPLLSRADVVLVCERPELTTNVLSGTVVDLSGTPVEGAWVSMGVDTTSSDGEGRFSLRLDDPDSFNARIPDEFAVDTGRLLAVKAGYLPAELRARGTGANGRPIWPQEVVLRLGRDPLLIAGRVVDEKGEPLAGIRVWIADPTFFGGLSDERRPERFPSLTHLENELAGVKPGWHYVTTDDDGAFVIEGLLDREYVLAAMDPATLMRVEARDVRAGDETVVVTLPAGESFPVLRGKVVDSRGKPIGGAEVYPMCDAFLTHIGGEVISTHHESAEATRTDAEGAFELRKVPRDLVYLRIEGADTIPLEWGRRVEGGLAKLVGEDAEKLVITVGRRCHFQVELAIPDEADTLSVLDAAGEELIVSEFFGQGQRESGTQSLTNGRTNMLAVADDAAWLVLFKGGAEVRRLPLALTPGEPTTVRP